MLREYNADAPDFSNAKDLLRDPVVTWQHKHYVPLTAFMNLGLPLLLGFWHGDVIGTVLLVGLLRLVVNHHVTFFINSLAHYWGSSTLYRNQQRTGQWFSRVPYLRRGLP